MFVLEVLEALIHEYSEEVVQSVVIPDQGQQFADDIRAKWNFLVHVEHSSGWQIRKNKVHKGLFYNYKGCFSVILLDLIDADYKFITNVSVGSNRSASGLNLGH